MWHVCCLLEPQFSFLPTCFLISPFQALSSIHYHLISHSKWTHLSVLSFKFLKGDQFCPVHLFELPQEPMIWRQTFFLNSSRFCASGRHPKKGCGIFAKLFRTAYLYLFLIYEMSMRMPYLLHKVYYKDQICSFQKNIQMRRIINPFECSILDFL